MDLNNILKSAFLSAILALASSAGFASEGSCSLSSFGDGDADTLYCSPVTELVSGISWELKGFPETHEAGDRIQFDIVLHKRQFLTSNWFAQPISIKLQIGETFSLHILNTEELKQFFYSEQDTQIFHVDEMIGEHIGGKASLRLLLSLLNREPPYDFCNLNLDLASIQINSELVDLEPPAVIGIHYSKDSYQAGETVTAYVEFSEELQYLKTNHITFKKGRDDFPEYSTPGFQLHRTNKDGYEYAIEFELKKEVLPGEYFLTCFNRGDIYGNFASTKHIAHLPPIVVRGE